MPEEGPAEAAINFAVRFALLRKDEAKRLSLVEVDYSDYEDIEASIPKCVPPRQSLEGQSFSGSQP